MDKSLKNFQRLYPSEALALAAIKNYNNERNPKEPFAVYNLVSGKKGDAISLLNECHKYAYLLPCSQIDGFNNKPGTYVLQEEKDVCNEELSGNSSSICLTALTFLIHENGKSFLKIEARRLPPMMILGGKSLPMIPTLEDLGLPHGFSLKRKS